VGIGDPASSTSYPGLWVYDPDVGGIGTPSYQWQADAGGDGNFANLSGATSSTYTLTSGEAGDDVRVQETLADNGGSRTVSSAITDVAAASSATAPAYSFSEEHGTNLGLNDTDTVSLPTAGDYIIAIASIGNLSATGAIDNGTVANSGNPLAELNTADGAVSWFHVSATAAATFTYTKTDGGTSFVRRIFVYDANDATATVRDSGTNATPSTNEVSVSLSGLTAGDFVLACVADRNDQSDPFAPTWGNELTEDQDAAFFISSAHGAAVASDTVTGSTFTVSVSDSGISANNETVLAVIALVPA
jgi:hypothetical protein